MQGFASYEVAFLWCGLTIDNARCTLWEKGFRTGLGQRGDGEPERVRAAQKTTIIESRDQGRCWYSKEET
eukprot:1050434-Prorocentrum_minimum.AAC.1